MTASTPVLFLIFNRPDVTKIVFEAIRKARPSKLYVAADGARKAKEGETEKCEAVRAIIEKVDWECEVKKLYREKNLGCKVAVSSAIDWFFQHEEEGIILEDDCLPDQSFFGYCAHLLAFYRDDERVMHISGDNFQFGIKRGEASYYFSRYSHIWGWASWRRAWKHYDVAMETFPAFKKNKKIGKITENYFEQIFWMGKFEKTYKGAIDTWDYQWNFAMWNQNGLAVIPNENLVSNIGFNTEATHTSSSNKFSEIPVHPVHEIKHALKVERNKDADEFSFKTIYKKNLPATGLMMLRYLAGKYFTKDEL